MNLLVLIPVGAILIALVIFLVMRNLKDEKKFEKQMNNDYDKPKVAADTDIEETMK